MVALLHRVEENMRTQLNVKISGISAAVSNNWTPISSLQNSMDEKTIAKFMKNTGVRGRYNSGANQTTSDLCFVAAEKLIEVKKINKKDIGALLLVTQSPDYKSPASACVLHGRLGLDEDCIAFDVNLGCSGFTTSLATAGCLLSNIVHSCVCKGGGGTSPLAMR